VYLTPATELAVTERGGMTKRLRGKTERALILGVGVLDGMTIRELKAILAHEYGHFRNRDTAGGGLAMAVTRSLIATTINLAKGGAASNFNPGWLFVRAFLKAFVRISQGASRLQEVLADRWAIHAYGSAAFANGLRHVVTSSVRFDAHADATVEEVLREDVPLSNLYRHEPTKAPDEHALATEIADAMGKTTPYDSHPSPEARIDLAEHVDIEGVETDAHDDEEAWALFSDRTALEHAMTAVIRERLAVGGVHVRAEAADANSRS
jgi:Zn-dependent protease with chaperone function